MSSAQEKEAGSPVGAARAPGEQAFGSRGMMGQALNIGKELLGFRSEGIAAEHFFKRCWRRCNVAQGAEGQSEVQPLICC